jgi:hypothetical protein
MSLSTPLERTLRTLLRMGVAVVSLMIIGGVVVRYLVSSSQASANEAGHHESQETRRHLEETDRGNPAILQSYGKLPLGFELNLGQTNSEVKL